MAITPKYISVFVRYAAKDSETLAKVQAAQAARQAKVSIRDWRVQIQAALDLAAVKTPALAGALAPSISDLGRFSRAGTLISAAGLDLTAALAVATVKALQNGQADKVEAAVKAAAKAADPVASLNAADVKPGAKATAKTPAKRVAGSPAPALPAYLTDALARFSGTAKADKLTAATLTAAQAALTAVQGDLTAALARQGAKATAKTPAKVKA